MAGNGELRTLTRGEKLLITRRRRGESQQEAAERYDTTRFLYGQWERGVSVGPSVRGFTSLKPYERCLLYRRRSNVTQEEVALDLGLCRWWINQMERGDQPCDQLLWYWEQ